MTALWILTRNLLLTVLIEGTLLSVLFHSPKLIYHSVLVNLLTNPTLNLLLLLALRFAPSVYTATLILGELAAFFGEAFLYHRLGDFTLHRAVIVSLALNAASFVFGLLL